MTAELRAGRIVGALVLIQLIGAFVLNFVVEAPLFGEPGFLVSAAPHALQIGAGVLLALALAGTNVVLALTVFPLIERHSAALARALLVVSAVGVAAAVLEQVNVMSMVSLSQAYAKAAAAGPAGFEPLRGAVAAARNWAHFLGLLVHGALLFVFYAAALRFRLLPRVLAVYGLAAVAIQMVVVSRPLFGAGIVFPLLFLLFIAQVALLVRLLWKGFGSPAVRAPAG